MVQKMSSVVICGELETISKTGTAFIQQVLMT